MLFKNCIFENKTNTYLHSDQFKKYCETVADWIVPNKASKEQKFFIMKNNYYFPTNYCLLTIFNPTFESSHKFGRLMKVSLFAFLTFISRSSQETRFGLWDSRIPSSIF